MTAAQYAGELGDKVLVLGCPGSGKSTFARKLQGLTGLPLYHLDNLWWKPDRTHITREEFDKKLKSLLQQEKWLLDGDYSRTYEPRIQACDTLFFLDFAEKVCMEGIVHRIGQERGDIPWTEQQLDPELVLLVRRYRELQRPRLLALFEKYPEKRIVVFKSREEAQDWLTDAEKEET